MSAHRVCAYASGSGAQSALNLESYHTIGAYRLTHRWVFQADGVVLPRLFNAALQCPFDQRHHTHWRFDFTLDGVPHELLLEYSSYAPDEGRGAGWHSFRTGTSRVRNAASRRSWAGERWTPTGSTWPSGAAATSSTRSATRAGTGTAWAPARCRSGPGDGGPAVSFLRPMRYWPDGGGGGAGAGG